MNIELYHVTLTLTSPAIVGARGSERGLLYTVMRDIVPGPSFHGTLVKAIASNMYSGSIITPSTLQTFVTPLYPVTRGGKLYRDATIAHALSIHGKGYASSIITSYNVEKVIDLLEHGLKLEEAIVKTITDYLDALHSYSLRLEMGLSVNVADLKSAQGVVVEKDHVGSAEVWKKVRVRKGAYLENAVDRVRGSVYAGALYGYEYIVPGTLFTGYVACSSGQGLCRDVSGIAGADVVIGKGQGRGFGRARIEIRQVAVENEAKTCCPVGEKLVALIATSPSFVADPIPRPVRAGDILETLSGVKLVIKHVIGSRLDVYVGWSRLRHSPKLVVRDNALGTILVAEVDNSKLTEPLCVELMMGMLKNSLPGFNTFQVIRRDPLHTSPETLVNLVKTLHQVSSRGAGT
jgi:hypothetical protein